MNWVEELLPEYRKWRRELSKKARELDVNMPYYANDIKQINSMLRTMTDDIKFMETGKDPMYQGGIHIHAVYHTKTYGNVDFIPDITEQLKENDINKKHLYLSEDEKIMLKDILSKLSKREEECYLMHVAQDKSMADIADELGIARGTVQVYVRRALKKVESVVGKDG
ncbi:sigma-70 family RNA polymerase sigma factor [Sporosarcina jiandibaonis]|uniref:sigma-70 family RNA polymerase sigma factor n=1 Tax=Sporosarcina jiandibaonis TaxID=2715535 RepID=UPI00155499B4|nr:sigma-70 family RNA polymerase sigma factor [Sporosarcina jiandibaonis]